MGLAGHSEFTLKGSETRHTDLILGERSHLWKFALSQQPLHDHHHANRKLHHTLEVRRQPPARCPSRSHEHSNSRRGHRCALDDRAEEPSKGTLCSPWLLKANPHPFPQTPHAALRALRILPSPWSKLPSSTMRSMPSTTPRRLASARS